MLFTPSNQIRDMLSAEIGQAYCGRGDLNRMVALNAQMQLQNQVQNQSLHVADNWLEDNWLDDLWV